MKFDDILKKIMVRERFTREIYDEIRLIDPVTKDVLSHFKNGGKERALSGHKCYDFFDRKLPCENCSSMLAMQRQEQVVKIDSVGASVYITMAQPLSHEGGQYVIEILKNITHSGMVGIEGKEVIALNLLLEQRNSMMLRDALTRVYRENFVNTRLPHNLYQVKAEKRRLSLIHVGISNLKEINDAHGYHVGDDVIRQFADLLKKCPKRSEDWVARYSGSEILIALFDQDEQETKDSCLKIYKKLNRIKLPEGQSVKKVIFTIGFIMPDGENTDIASLLSAARRNICHRASFLSGPDERALLHQAFPGMSMSEREEETALLILSGLSNQEIAKTMFIALSTVKKHVARILKESGTKSRGEFISKVLR